MADQYHVLNADVIIIGAGVSGMMAAYSIIQKEPSLHVLIVEATDRIGGRTASKALLISNKDFDIFDTGGQWISSQQTILFDLLKELNIAVESNSQNGKVLVDYEEKLYEGDNRETPFEFCSIAAKIEFANFITKIESICNGKTSLNANLVAMNMQEFIEENISNNTNKAIIKMMILINCGVEAADISVGFYVFFCISNHGITNQLSFHQNNGLHEFWIKNGAQQICNKISILLEHGHRTPIEYNARVKKIKMNLHHVEIISSGGTLYSRNVVVSIPPCDISKIKFTPPLSQSKLEAFTNSVEGQLSKFVVTYEEAFWKKNDYTGDVYVLNNYSKTKPIVCCFDITIKNKSGLMGYIWYSDGVTQSVILQQLAQYFGNSALNPLQFAIQNWKNGSPMNCYKSFEDMRQAGSTTGRIFWCGAETSMEWYGTIAGAVISGNRVAREVIYDLRPAALTREDMTFLELNMSKIQKRNRSHNSIYQKLANRYYQVSTAAIVVLLAVIIWRKGKLNTRLKNIVIKS